MMAAMQAASGLAPNIARARPTAASAISAQADAIEVENDARIREINARGKTVGGIDTHAIVEMLAFLLTPDQLALAKLNQQRWLSAQLDEIEKSLRERVFTDLTPGAGVTRP